MVIDGRRHGRDCWPRGMRAKPDVNTRDACRDRNGRCGRMSLSRSKATVSFHVRRRQMLTPAILYLGTSDARFQENNAAWTMIIFIQHEW